MSLSKTETSELKQAVKSVADNGPAEVLSSKIEMQSAPKEEQKRRPHSPHQMREKSKSHETNFTREGTPRNIEESPKSVVMKTATRAQKTAPATPTNSTLSRQNSIKSATSTNGGRDLMVRNLERQFYDKRQRLEDLKKEYKEKQKPLLDTHRALIALQKRLKNAGKAVQLEKIQFGEYGLKCEKAAAGERTEVLQHDDETQKQLYDEMVGDLRKIPVTLLGVCQSMMSSRKEAIAVLEKQANGTLGKEELSNYLEKSKTSTSNIEEELNHTYASQENEVTNLLEKWQKFMQKTESSDSEALQAKIEQLESRVSDLRNKLHAEQQRNSDSLQDKHTLMDLHERIKNLEKDLAADKAELQETKGKLLSSDQKVRTLKNHVKELDLKKKETDTKYDELESSLNTAKQQFNTKEQRWSKEKDELLKAQKQDRQLIEKLTNDKTCIDARMQDLQSSLQQRSGDVDSLQMQYGEDVEKLRSDIEKGRREKEDLQTKLQVAQNHIREVENKYKQSIDLINSRYMSKIGDEGGMSSTKEVELMTKMVALESNLKNADEHIKDYENEKMRFIETIHSIAANSDRPNSSVALLEKDEEISRLEKMIAKKTKLIDDLQSRTKMLATEVENQKQHIEVLQKEGESKSLKEGDVRTVVQETRMKLARSLQKSKEDNERMIKMEFEINKLNNHILDMENLMKSRDGLIAMIKAKKDEIAMENKSLQKYGNELRSLQLQDQEELTIKNEQLKALMNNLATKSRLCQKLEDKVKELETSLSLTNEKRFRLQDTVSSMEKELRSTKAHLLRSPMDLTSSQRFDYSMKKNKNSRMYNPDQSPWN